MRYKPIRLPGPLLYTLSNWDSWIHNNNHCFVWYVTMYLRPRINCSLSKPLLMCDRWILSVLYNAVGIMPNSSNSSNSSIKIPSYSKYIFRLCVVRMRAASSLVQIMTSHLFAAQRRHMATYIWVKFDSGNGLLLDNTKPLPEPILTLHQWGQVIFIWWQFHRR